MFRFGQIDPSRFNDQLKDMYNWSNVAERTEKVYGSVYQTKNSPLIERLRRYYGCGLYAGKIFCMVMALDYLIWRFLEWLFPANTIEKARSFPYQKYNNFFLQHKQSHVVRQNNIIQQVVQEVDEEGCFSTQHAFSTEPSEL